MAVSIKERRVIDRNGRTLAFLFDDVIMRAGLDRDSSVKRKIEALTGKPIRECQMDRAKGCSRVIRCFHCNGHFTPDDVIEWCNGVPYHDAGRRPFHAACLEVIKR